MGKSEKPIDTDFMLELSSRILQETSTQLSVSSSSVHLDKEYLRKRSESEGISFHVKTLPHLARALDCALAKDEPFVTPPGFKTWEYGSVTYPTFLKWVWPIIFDSEGQVRPGNVKHQVDAVRLVRQIGYLHYKLEVPHSKEVVEEFWDQFIELDSSLPDIDGPKSLSKETIRAIDTARLVLSMLFMRFDPHGISPKHGPGAVATKERGPEKWRFSRFYRSIDSEYPYPDYIYFSYTHFVDQLQDFYGLEEVDAPSAKATLVPKDSRGPRLISMEPLELMYLQQGLKAKLYEHIEASHITAGYVNFTSQDVNRYLAFRGSFGDRTNITVDLKDASDRVSAWIVKEIFPTNLWKCLVALRSVETITPRGTVTLKKFAPMGSALCFPIEALTFWALAVGSIVDIVTYRDLDRIPEVYVYGDDIVLSAEHFQSVKAVFEECHLAFNEQKSCTGTFFRESCGFDAFKGNNVTPVRVKPPWPQTRLSPKALLSYIAYANALRGAERPLVETSLWLETQIRKQYEALPYTNSRCGLATAFYRDVKPEEIELMNYFILKHRFNRKLHRDEVQILLPQAVTYELQQSDGWAAVQEWRTKTSHTCDPYGFGDPYTAVGRYVIPDAIRVGKAWYPVELVYRELDQGDPY